MRSTVLLRSTRPRRARLLAGVAAAPAALVLLAGCGTYETMGGEGSGEPGTSTGGDEAGEEGVVSEGEEVTPSATTEVALRDAEGAGVGTVYLTETDTAQGAGVEVRVEATDLTPGFHGFHVHTTGLCEPDSADPADPSTTGAFLSAGGHLAAEDQDHGDHTGDLPSLLAGEDGAAEMTVVTTSFTLDDLADADGSAFMVHDGPDNFANIPERYAPDGPDETTLKTGDSGDRIACGVVEAS